MKKNVWRFLMLLGISSLVTASVLAQDKPDARVLAAAGDRYVISAKAGGVGLIEGKVFVEREKGKSGLLLKGDSLEINDKVTTDATGKVEILLNPGSYLRLGGNAEFKFINTDLEKLTLNLTRGSGIFEVYASSDYKVTVQTPKTKYYFVDSGVFRIDVASDKETISVWKGSAQIGDGSANVVKAGRRAVLTTGDNFAIAKFDRDEGDALDTWSKSRSKELAQINKRLQRDLLRSSLLDTYRNRGWGFYESYGLWVFDPITGAYCFLPFGRGWRSPYGYGFGYTIWDYNYPWTYYPHPSGNPPSQQPPTQTPPNTEPTQAQIREQRRIDAQTPPFQRVNQGSYRGGESSGGNDSGGINPGGGGFDYSSSGSKGSSSPPSSPPPSPPVSSPPIIVNNPSPDSDSKGKP